ncbi:MAG: flagellar biosynthesis protein FlgJ [Alphaproteobacteria bacterium]|jgi:Rod binding domain-containing protein|nr:flagellar biosynthesis protein FlgJ [Alphaproteobacteria bacterium]
MLPTVAHTLPLNAPQKRLETAARGFEAAFLAQMLAAAGAGKPADTFGGGIGESQFASFLLDAQAQHIAQRGGVGLAETIIRHYGQS